MCPTVPLSHCNDEYMSLSFTVSHCPIMSLTWQIHVTLFYCVPLSHHLNPMPNTCYSLLACPTVPPSQCNAKYMLPLSHHLTDMTNKCHSLLLCPTISMQCQIHVTLFYCVPLSHCFTGMPNTSHFILLCPTVPLSHCHDKYLSLSFTVSHCPTISLPGQIHDTFFYCVNCLTNSVTWRLHPLTTKTTKCHFFGCLTVSLSHWHNKYMPCNVSNCPTIALS
jgi:hypothetical protein